ncbi:1-acyl-sn-glycerol-3-phosphate acyltransferase [Ligilactobacillus pabuli]|uniref:1-acyl-sn-glycerol-3-phosphate acyltransferase n=1 Tax=Ligilactobacillus pabuli TaxID=2886039 RepID=A0ABQ5JJN1_9LACO|nr:acyl-phosphate glycerol 3-phosphate acyltransferase [Ligilactobacillus pabuli]GKS81682.1 1-acyl-sn-glycerol-3-phosphate acyltransferase [Ligilactobacillus pabuli]
MSKKKTYFYDSFNEDLVTAKQQDYSLPEDYQWETKNGLQRSVNFLTRHGVRALSYLFCPFVLFLHRDRSCQLTAMPQTGCYLYVNHTQTVGDALIPYYILRKKWPAIVVTPANLSLPIIGKLIPHGGGLPIPGQLRRLRDFKQAVFNNIKSGKCVVIYPEAHLWPYYTKIRPFQPAAFHYPAADQAAVYCLTNTYQKCWWRKKPRITSYLDGPFFAPADLSPKKRQEILSQQVHECMTKRSQQSTYEYLDYQRREPQ